MYTTTIQKWGNSQAVRIPKPILEEVSLGENEDVEIMVDNNAIIIKKSLRKKRTQKSIERRLEEFYQKDIESILADDTLYVPEEVDWGESVGREAW